MSDGWVEFDPNRRPPAMDARDTWEAVKRERGWKQLPGETVAEMDARLRTGLSPQPESEPRPGVRVVLEVPPMSDREWQRIKHCIPCPVCGHSGGWCTVAPDGDAIQCRRVQSNRPVKNKDGTVGYLHPIPDGPLPPSSVAKPVHAPRRSPAEWELLHRQHRSAVNPEKLRAFAAYLGVSAKALEAFGIGAEREALAWTFPMRDACRRVIGIRRRHVDGRGYRCVPGSENGLFIPEDYSPRRGDWLVVPEGPTDAAAAWDMALRVVGRPNSSAGAAMLAELLRQSPGEGLSPTPQDVVIVGENDGPKWALVADPPPPLFPGFEGAVSACRAVLDSCAALRCIVPPRPHKDLRDWRTRGRATLADVAGLIDRASPVVPGWLALADKVIERRKREAVETFRRSCERIAAYAAAGEAAKADRVRAWMARRGYPVNVKQRQAAA